MVLADMSWFSEVERVRDTQYASVDRTIGAFSSACQLGLEHRGVAVIPRPIPTCHAKVLAAPFPSFLFL